MAYIDYLKQISDFIGIFSWLSAVYTVLKDCTFFYLYTWNQNKPLRSRSMKQNADFQEGV